MLQAILGAITAFVLAQPAVRQLIEEVAVKAIIDVLSRRAEDPEYEAKSDAVFERLRQAKTKEEVTDAQNALRVLLSS